MTKFVFSGYNDGVGYEPFLYDSELNSTRLIANIRAGANSSANLSTFNSISFKASALFSAIDDTHGAELWSTDGTEAGTYLVKDIAPGIRDGLNTLGSPLVAAGQFVYFAATTVGYGTELWRTDGTEQGTRQIIDLNPGAASSSPYQIKPVNGGVAFTTQSVSGLFFATQDDVIKISGQTSYNYSVTRNSIVYSLSTNNKYELHVFDTKTNADSVIIGPENTFGIHRITNVYGGADLAYFSAELDSGSNQLWVTDGTSTGTHAVLDFGSAYIGYGTEQNTFGNRILINTGYLNNGSSWISDGTASGSFKIANNNTFYSQLENNNKLYMLGSSTDSKNELWVTDGTTAGTSVIFSAQYLKLLGFDGHDVVVSYRTNDYKYYLAELSQSGSLINSVETAQQVNSITQISEATNHGKSLLVDDSFYFARNADVFAAHLDAATHFNNSGWHEGRDPNALFSTNGYLSVNSDIAEAGINPLAHYHSFGWKEGRDPSASFDNELYLKNNEDVAKLGIDPLAHYLQYGQAEGRQTYAAIGKASDFTHGSFDAEYYLLANADVAKAALAAGGDTFAFAFQHYQSYGAQEGRKADAYFDSAYYLAHNPDVAAAHINPLDHYDQFGWQEGRAASAAFDTHAYLAANPDVAAAHIDPLLHYLQYGALEGRHLA